VSLLLALLLLPAGASAKDAKSLPCTDSGGTEHRGCLEPRGGGLAVRQEVLAALPFVNGVAALYARGRGWMYADRTGRVVVDNVAAYDNGPESFHDGLVRVERGHKCGFSDKTGATVVPVIYDGCRNFEKGAARVCSKCRLACDDKDCEHRSLKGGEWLCVDKSGRRVACP
jgi:hypothetical protein